MTTTSHSLRSRLELLSRNLWWSWDEQTRTLFHDIDPELWREVGHNPIMLLNRLPDPVLADRLKSHDLQNRVVRSIHRLEEYLAAKDTWASGHAGLLNVQPVAYFCAEFGIHESLPLYSGGLGILAGDHMKSSSDLGVPLVGVGIYYAEGYFNQYSSTQNGWQQEEFGAHEHDQLPVEIVRGPDGKPLIIDIPAGTSIVRAQIRKAMVGRNQLLLLDTDIEGNDQGFREVTHRLYWGDRTSRIRQEIVLGIGGLRALRTLNITPSVYHLNEGHSSFALLEAIHFEMKANAVSFDEACHRIGSRTVFTTHTPVPAGHDRFAPKLIESQLGWLRQALGLDQREFLALGRVDPENEGETFCMTVLAMKIAHRTNGVSNLHGDVSRRMWQDLWPERRAADVPIGHITNGIHTSSWVSSGSRHLLERHLGTDWLQNLASGEGASKVLEIRDEEMWETRLLRKTQLIDFVRQRHVTQEARRGVDPGAARERARELLDPAALTIGFARRFATYKRATLFLQQRDRLERLLTATDRPLQFIFAGKAHPADDGGKSLIQEIVKLQDAPPFKNRLAFVENYDIEVGRELVQGVDVWLNNPIRPEEACGTSGMKVVLNGGLNFSILDGWWAEAWDGNNGFAIRSEGPHTDNDIQAERDAQALFDTLEHTVIPMYHDRDATGLPRAWVARMKNALAGLAWRFSADRMLVDYVSTRYVPAAGGTSEG